MVGGGFIEPIGRGALLAPPPSSPWPRPAPSALVDRCVSGEPRAWRALHRIYHPMAVAFLRKLGIDDGELDDACQDVFVQVFRYLPRFRGEAELKTWLFRLCASEAANVRRRARTARTAATLLRRELAARPPVCGLELSAEMARRKIHAALAALKQDEREAFVLHEMEGVSGERIAALAGCPVATVWRRLHYARRTFQTALADGRAAPS
jgi:RNA polymerase sigma-70 factor (ECF subfamily)